MMAMLWELATGWVQLMGGALIVQAYRDWSGLN